MWLGTLDGLNRWNNGQITIYRNAKASTPGPPQIPLHYGKHRIQSELRLLGFEVAERNVAKYRIEHAEPLSQTWKIFPINHVMWKCGPGLGKAETNRRAFDGPQYAF